MSTTTALVLTFLAAVCASLAAADPFGVPTWVQVLIAALSAGFAAIGIPAVARTTRYTRRRDVQ